MASNTHVDGRVAERRLRPIYDWLDLGNNKKALQEADKVLKKQPKLLCAKVLKALALQRLGREAECEDILDSVCSQTPTDEPTLQAITICYKALDQPEKVCEVYAAASKKDPTNEELLTNLFMSYVKVGNYKKQQQYAMSLYKLRPKNPYYFWAVMSVVMQAKCDPKVKDSLSLRLAEKMVSKFVSEGKIEAEQEVQLYLMILEMQGKYEEALDVIEGPLGEKMKSLVTTATKRIELLIKLERWREANVLLQLELKKSPDSWCHLTSYLDTVLRLHSAHVQQTNSHKEVDYRVPLPHEEGECIVWGEADHLPSQARSFLLTLAEDSSSRIRGPRLALLELYKCLQRSGIDPKPVLGDAVDMLVEYFELFGAKPICVADMQPYLELLSLESASLLMKRISDIVGLADGESPTSVTTLYRHISRLQLGRHLGFHNELSTEERVSFAELLMGHYRHGASFVQTDRLPTEYSCNDPYALLASHVLYSVYLESRCPSYLLRAICHLEEALAASPSNYCFKLLLVKFYLVLGAGEQAFYYFELLETKHIQLDSMGYLLCYSLYGLGCLSHAVSIYDASLKFFAGNTNDSVDHVAQAYKYGSFLKVDEFVAFMDKINDSLNYTFYTVEKIIHDALSAADFAQTEQTLTNMEVNPGTNKIEWEQHTDNRDLTVLINYEPEGPTLPQETVRTSFLATQYYVKLRAGLLRCLAAGLDLAVCDKGSEMENGETQHKDTLQGQLEELRRVYEEVNALDLHVKETIHSPPPCRLANYLKIPMLSVLDDMTAMLLAAEDGNGESASRSAVSVTQTAHSVTETMKALLKGATLTTRGNAMEITVSAVEMLSVAAVLCGAVKKLTQKGSSKGGKKGRRKREDSEPGGTARCLAACQTLLTEVSRCMKTLEGVLGERTELINLTSDINNLNLNGEDFDFTKIKNKLKDSHISASTEVKQFLEARQAYIQLLLS